MQSTISDGLEGAQTGLSDDFACITPSVYPDPEARFSDDIGFSLFDDEELTAAATSDSYLDHDQDRQDSEPLDLLDNGFDDQGTPMFDNQSSKTSRARGGPIQSLSKTRRYKQLPVSVTQGIFPSSEACCPPSLPFSDEFKYDSAAVRIRLSKDRRTVAFELTPTTRPGRRTNALCSYFHPTHWTGPPKCRRAVQFMVCTVTGPESDRKLLLVEGACEGHRMPESSIGPWVRSYGGSLSHEHSHRIGKVIRGKWKVKTSDPVASGSIATSTPTGVVRLRQGRQFFVEGALVTRYMGLVTGNSPSVSGASNSLVPYTISIHNYPSRVVMDGENFRYDSKAVWPRFTSPSSTNPSAITFHKLTTRSRCSYYPTEGRKRQQLQKCCRAVQYIVFSFTGPPESRRLALVEGSCNEHQEIIGSARGLPLMPEGHPITFEHSHRADLLLP